MSDNEDLPVYAQNLKLMIEKAGISQAELARRANVNKDALNRYILGKTRPPNPKLMHIAKALGCKPSDIDPMSTRLDRLMSSMKTPQIYDLKPPLSGRDGYVYMRVDAEIPVAAAMEIIGIINKHLE